MRIVSRPTALLVVLYSALALLAIGCAVNPVTGKRELSLIPESQEIQMGRDADREIVATMGLYPDEAVQAYVGGLGRKLAASSERPNLPWTFRVVDDPVVNAFALPGGFVYVTRGLMTHLNSEAELVAVLGHEVGHVTAKHGVAQASRAQIAQIGLGVGSLLKPGLDELAGIASQGIGLLFLKFGRDDERQADDIGFRYLVRSGYDPRPMAEVFDTLARVSAAQGGGRVPSWMSTHPAPENRRAWADGKIAASGIDPSRAVVGRDPYLDRVSGMTFGNDPRQGFFKGDTFHHPAFAFRIDFPPGWKTQNRTDAVDAGSPGQDAAVRLSMAAADSPQAALEAFLNQKGIQAGSSWQGDVHGLQAAAREFQTTSGQTKVDGVASFVKLDSRVFQIVGFATETGWRDQGSAIRASLASFQRLTDPKILAVRPWKVEIVTTKEAMTLQQFAAKYPGPAPVATVALVNHLDAAARVPAGTKLKRIVGEPLP